MSNLPAFPVALRTVFALAATAALALGPAAPAAAEGFPTKPVTLVVPFPPGGPTDTSARLFSTVMSAKLGQPVIVENRAGAGGSVGTAAVTRDKADGYTLLWGGPRDRKSTRLNSSH